MTDQISAAVFRDGAADATIEPVALQDLRDDEVLVRLAATGICHTDLTCRDGFAAVPRPVILGHEGAGHVEKVGSTVRSVAVGDPVVLTFASCGECSNCARGVPAYCLQFAAGNFTGRRLDGTSALCGHDDAVSAHFFGQSSFATHSVAQESSVVKVRADAPLDLLGPLGCGVQTGAGSVFNLLKAQPGESIAIFGAGGVGLSAVMAAKVAGCAPIIVVEPNAERRALARELGADHTIDPTDGEPVPEQIAAITGGMLHLAFDTSGIPVVIEQAIASLTVAGRIALVTGNAIDAMLQLPLLGLVGRGLTIRGVNMGDSVPQQFIPKLVDLVMDGRFPLEKMVRFYTFDQINQALHDQGKGICVKPILLIGKDRQA